MKHFLKYLLFFAMITLIRNYANSQDTLNVFVKVYDIQLNPAPEIGITFDNAKPFKTDSEGTAFVSIPVTSLPPAHIDISDQKLEAESWNYSKGILEIILRKKNYRHLKIKIVDADYKALKGIEVNITSVNPSTYTTDSKGLISLILPNSIQVTEPDLFYIDGYYIARSNLNNEGGTLVIEEIRLPEKIVSVDNVAETDQIKAVESVKNQDIKDKTEKLFDLGLQDIDSITSLTVLYTLMKKVNYKELDSLHKKKLDNKFNELLQDSIYNSFDSRSTLELISDSSLVNKDVMLIIEKIQNERKYLIQFREEFEKATNQIKLKLKEGGKNLSSDERIQLIQLFLDLREMLRKNEELFYKNNIYYKEQVEALRAQIADIHELEDQVSKSEALSQKFKEQLLYTSLIIAGLLIFLMIITFFARLFLRQKNKLKKANTEIEKINNNLENLVAAKTDSLKLINKELDTFLYRSSHNLKRPLTTMKGLANIAELTLNNDGVSLFEKVILNTREMEKMLDKLTMVSYINQPVDFGDINIKQIGENIQSKFSDQIKGMNITFNISCQPDIQFKSYPLVVEVILHNLCENAIFFSQFNRKGFPEVDISFSLDENRGLCLSVKDNGCGIQPDVQNKIWDMFFVGNELSKGNGLGLYITKKAVESLQGTIQLKTEADEYCEFNILLPAIYVTRNNVKKLEVIETE